jgi:glycosyltransferase involved in cell wall biosynthesis
VAQLRTIRITYVIGGLAIGGAETQLVRLVDGLDRRRFQPSIICLVEGGDLEDRIRHDVAVVKPSGPLTARGRRLRRIMVGLRALWLLLRALRRQQPEVVHAYLAAAYVPASLAAWIYRVPLIVAGRRGFTSSGIYLSVPWRLVAWLANRVIDLQICNSTAACEFVISHEGVKRERTRVINNGIDLPPLAGAVLPPDLVSEGPQAVMVANLIRYKGHAEVLRAAARVVERHPDFRIVLLGDGPERSALKRLCADLDLETHVAFAGLRQDAARLIQGFDFSVLGSSEESLPNAVMESMAVGVPVVATNVGGVPELVGDGVHGKLVAYGDIEAMADAMIWMLEHPDERRRMGEAGRHRIATEFSTERMVTQTQDAYEDFLAIKASRQAAT